MTLQTVASLTIITDTQGKATARANKTFIVQASLMIITYDRQNIFIVQATGLNWSLGTDALAFLVHS